jgi:hypothetical protein
LIFIVFHRMTGDIETCCLLFHRHKLFSRVLRQIRYVFLSELPESEPKRSICPDILVFLSAERLSIIFSYQSSAGFSLIQSNQRLAFNKAFHSPFV